MDKNSDQIPFDCTFEFIDNVCGSVLVSQGDSCSVVCSVKGPAEVRFSAEIIDRATIEVTYIPSDRVPDPNDRLISVYLKKLAQKLIITSMHPRSLISITIQQLRGKRLFLAYV